MTGKHTGGRGSGQDSFVVKEYVFTISASRANERKSGDLSGATGRKNVSCVTRLPFSCFLLPFLFISYLCPFSHHLNGKSTPAEREIHTTPRENHTVLRESHTIQEVAYEA